MNRKLIQLSPTTTVISLPKSWTTSQRLKKGDEVSVQTQGNTLLVKASGASQVKKAKIVMSGAKTRGSRTLADWFAVSGAYIAGCTQIELQFPDKESAATADKFTTHMPGLISEQISQKVVLLKDIGADVIDVEKIVQKLFHLLVSMSEEIADPIVRKKKDFTINSYTALGLRQLRIQSYDPIVWSGLFYALEQLGDTLVYSKTNDAEKIKDLQILFLSYSPEKLLELVEKLDSKKPLDQQLLTCVQSIQQVRSNLE